MNTGLIQELKEQLAWSDSRLRKHWAERIIAEKIPTISLMPLLHGDWKTAQRLTWLIGDLLHLKADAADDCLPLLFELRDQMPFPGMQRTVAKCLWVSRVPDWMLEQAAEQLLSWLDDEQCPVSVKHYASKALFRFVSEKGLQASGFEKVLERQTGHANQSHARRMEKLLKRVRQYCDGQ